MIIFVWSEATECVVIGHSSSGITKPLSSLAPKKSERDSFMIVKRRGAIPLSETMPNVSFAASAMTPQRLDPNNNVVMVSLRYYPF